MKVFVYGTLKRNQPNNIYMDQESAGGRYLGLAKTQQPTWTMVDLGRFPAVVMQGNSYIYGELYEVPNLEKLDKLEGYPYLYDRIETVVVSPPEVPQHQDKAWIYVLKPSERIDNYKIISSGTWGFSPISHDPGDLRCRNFLR